jgi:hemolysin III
MMISLLLENFPNDSGPIYAETVAGRFPVEPYNTYSNFLFLGIILYFGYFVIRNYKRHLFLAACLPVLVVSWIGGTMYHATRSAQLWLYLDWVPIVTLCLAVSVYFIFKIAHQWWHNVLILIVVLSIVVGGRMLPWPASVQISAGYVLTVLGLLLPLFLYLYKTQFRNVLWVLLAVLSFAVAVTFRSFDSHIDTLPMGSHWLWHSFGAVAVFFLMLYIYQDRLPRQS